jgi:hypothetical protein
MTPDGLQESAEELTERGPMWKPYAMILIMVLTWIVSAAVQIGFNSAHTQDQDRRLVTVETEIEKKVDRREYDARQQDVINRLERIENKLDQGH